MKITRIGSDYITIDEDNLDDEKLISIPRVHLIKLLFFRPNKDKVNKVLKLYPKTNRYVIEDNIKFYNGFLRNTSKKYYISNTEDVDLISFFRKNNKVLLDFLKLTTFEREFLLLDNIFKDLLRNVEVIQIDDPIFHEKKEVLEKWNGNVIIR